MEDALKWAAEAQDADGAAFAAKLKEVEGVAHPVMAKLYAGPGASSDPGEEPAAAA